MEKEVATELVERKTPQVLKHLPNLGAGWQVHYVLFARARIKPVARAATAALGVELVDLPKLDAVLCR